MPSTADMQTLLGGGSTLNMWLPIMPWFFNKPSWRSREYAEPKTWHKEETAEKPTRGYPSHSAMAGISDVYSGIQMMTQHEINRAVRHSQIGKITLKAGQKLICDQPCGNFF